MSVSIDIQMACPSEESPDEDSILRWVSAALGNRQLPAELSVRIVDEQESAALNLQYRALFAAVTPEPLPILGDLVICAPVVAREAREQHKSLQAHWAHMLVHGTLHLLGYDHIHDSEAEEMEALETTIIQGLGFPAPYQELPPHE